MKLYKKILIRIAGIFLVLTLAMPVLIWFTVINKHESEAVVSSSHAKRLNRESFYQDAWCAERKGITEYQLPSRTRVDCLTETEAVEVDFANKWYEAVGQSLFYSLETGKQAAILLILEKSKDHIYLRRMQETIKYFNLPIVVYTVKYDD